MLINPAMQASKRQKLFHAIIFFVENTRACHKLKLFKLLYHFDFEIYRQTGRGAIELSYHAWPMGPVPTELHEEFERPRADMKQVVAIYRDAPDDPDGDNRLRISPRVPFDEDQFTPREMRVLRQLVDIYKDATAAMMTSASHVRGGPWDQVFKKQPQGEISYRLALDDRADSVSVEDAEEIEQEAREAAAIFE